MNKLRILVVEDDPVVADDICACLEGLNYEILGPAYDAATATELCATNKFDLALLDIHLNQHGEGILLARKIREIIPVPIIFLTASGDDKTLAQAREVHPEHYLLKPFNGAQLKAALEIVFYNFRHPDAEYETRARIGKFNQSIPEALSEREVEIVVLLLDGLSNAEIGERLFISLHTVKTHVKRIFHKTGAESRTQLISMLHHA